MNLDLGSAFLIIHYLLYPEIGYLMTFSFNSILLILQAFVLGYFVILNLTYALSLLLASKQFARNFRRSETLALKDLLEQHFYKPISILVPAYNEEATINASLLSFLNLFYPEFEVITINDGSKDTTMDILIESYQLVEIPDYGHKSLKTQPVKQVYRSLLFSNLIVIDKENGGKADALNVGLQFAKYPLFCAVDADSLLDAEALIRTARLFVEDDNLVAAGGTIRPVNNAKVESGQISDIKVPRTWLERFQVVEYSRAFLTGRSAFAQLNMLVIISGAFGIFRRYDVIEMGGYLHDTIGEDMELAVRLHRHALENKKPYKIDFVIEPMCWTQVPDDWKTLLKQRNRWQRGLWESLWIHKDIFLNPKYGRIGMIAMPYFFLFEAVAPIIEVLGYGIMIYLIATGNINWSFAILFLILTIFTAVLISIASFAIEVFLLARYPKLKDRFILFGASILENFGYRQVIAFERFVACFQVLGKKGEWGDMTRKKI